MLKKLNIKSRRNYNGFLTDYSGYALFNTDRITRYEANTSDANDTDLFYKENDDDRSSPMKFTIDETVAQVTTYKDTPPVSNSVKLPLLEDGYSGGTSYEYEDVKNIVYGLNDSANNNTTCRVLIVGKHSEQFVALTIEELEALVQDGAYFTTFTFLADDNDGTGNTPTLTVDTPATIDIDARTLTVEFEAGTDLATEKPIATFVVYGDAADAVSITGGADITSGTTELDLSTGTLSLDIDNSADSVLAKYTLTATVAS